MDGLSISPEIPYVVSTKGVYDLRTGASGSAGECGLRDSTTFNGGGQAVWIIRIWSYGLKMGLEGLASWFDSKEEKALDYGDLY